MMLAHISTIWLTGTPIFLLLGPGLDVKYGVAIGIGITVGTLATVWVTR